ncbi:Alpha/beta hydrolase family [Frankia canadensis]|uniref:Alpha/beta hydrolase family n=1 Tax=Frankia canadensis TaxID=1836972 RepID=A0A2I2KJW7_9ACTN|nr:Alpha/beta hydrolase family [Frankia canadensis]SOU53240.1 Alpha/beta hydrolase family [Frankia canadensis]
MRHARPITAAAIRPPAKENQAPMMSPIRPPFATDSDTRTPPTTLPPARAAAPATAAGSVAARVWASTGAFRTTEATRVPAARTDPTPTITPTGLPVSPVRGSSGPADGSRVDIRSTVAVLMGRGENADAFTELADRLALDGHRLTVVPDGAHRIPAVVETRVPGVPFVLLGSDTGALAALAMVGSPAVRPDGLILLGLPLLHVPVAGLPVEEPSPRTLPDLPILLMHGADDEVSPLPLVRMTTRTAPRAELGVTPGGHDLLAGPGRRSVAARTVLFLESLRDC